MRLLVVYFLLHTKGLSKTYEISDNPIFSTFVLIRNCYRDLIGSNTVVLLYWFYVYGVYPSFSLIDVCFSGLSHCVKIILWSVLKKHNVSIYMGELILLGKRFKI